MPDVAERGSLPGGSGLAAAFLLAACASAAGAPAAREGARAEAPPDPGLDHIVVVVEDLEAAAEQYRRLGFALKPGRPHANGIRNRHVKFPDGTEIELLAAPEERDALTREYRRHLARGEGPAFLALYASAPEALARVLEGLRPSPRRQASGLIAFPEGSALRHIFFGRRNRSPTDQPEHFAHANGAQALIGVWLAGDDLSAERTLLTRMGCPIAEDSLHTPTPVPGTTARLPEGEILLLPGSRQVVPGRRIVGATLRTRDLEGLRQSLAAAYMRVPPVVRTRHGASVFLPPEMTHGLWLEFRGS